ncbi:MAG: hypothetical protein WBB08_10140 [Halobacteriota archaeon]|jgi:hypothetical protein|uniref:Uncharacterized protein n=1 Tax=Candidatus Methanophaga sp. ANME-1 ERB7 TaxID=2759913 RepID=A0A7G9Z558_9EURY|nr:hypothetical protein BNGNOALE_00018 [Methanosarcinales archaeon ANME-1 ERB7]
MAIGRTDNMDKITVIEKRLGIIVGARLRDRNRIENAISTQDRLRKKSKGWNGAKEIRKWRESR